MLAEIGYNDLLGHTLAQEEDLCILNDPEVQVLMQHFNEMNERIDRDIRTRNKKRRLSLNKNDEQSCEASTRWSSTSESNLADSKILLRTSSGPTFVNSMGSPIVTAFRSVSDNEVLSQSSVCVIPTTDIQPLQHDPIDDYILSDDLQCRLFLHNKIELGMAMRRTHKAPEPATKSADEKVVPTASSSDEDEPVPAIAEEDASWDEDSETTSTHSSAHSVAEQSGGDAFLNTAYEFPEDVRYANELLEAKKDYSLMRTEEKQKLEAAMGRLRGGDSKINIRKEAINYVLSRVQGYRNFWRLEDAFSEFCDLLRGSDKFKRKILARKEGLCVDKHCREVAVWPELAWGTPVCLRHNPWIQVQENGLPNYNPWTPLGVSKAKVDFVSLGDTYSWRQDYCFGCHTVKGDPYFKIAAVRTKKKQHKDQYICEFCATLIQTPVIHPVLLMEAADRLAQGTGEGLWVWHYLVGPRLKRCAILLQTLGIKDVGAFREFLSFLVPHVVIDTVTSSGSLPLWDSLMKGRSERERMRKT